MNLYRSKLKLNRTKKLLQIKLSKLMIKPFQPTKLVKLFSLLIIFLISEQSVVFSQFSVETGVNQGYEWNIFNNPELMIENSDTLRRSDLWQNSTFNEFFLETSYIREWENSRAMIRIDGSTNLYHQAEEAHEIYYSVYSSYRVRYGDGKYFEINPDFSRKQQDGIDLTDPVFSSRLSYYQVKVPLHFDFYLGNLAWMRFETHVRRRVYDQFDRKQTSYNSYYAEAHIKKSIDDIGRFDHEIELENRTSYRDQINADFDSQGAFLENDFRQFTKNETEILYRLQNRKDRFEISFPVTGTLFYDHPTGNLDYREIEAGTEIELRFGKTRIDVEAERTIRSFQNFEVGSNGNKLFYNYWTLEGGVEYEFNRRVSLNLKMRYKTRTSTRERLSTAFYREYTNSYIQSGIEIQL